MYESGSPLLRKVNGYIINWNARQCNTNPYEGVNGVSVQRDNDQEDAAQTVDDGEEQAQLWRRDKTKQ